MQEVVVKTYRHHHQHQLVRAFRTVQCRRVVSTGIKITHVMHHKRFRMVIPINFDRKPYGWYYASKTGIVIIIIIINFAFSNNSFRCFDTHLANLIDRNSFFLVQYSRFIQTLHISAARILLFRRKRTTQRIRIERGVILSCLCCL